MDTESGEKLEETLNAEFIRRYDKPAPRYTSYPPATSFDAGFDRHAYLEVLKNSNHQGPNHLSFYFHIPFCPTRCLFCGCQTEIGRGRPFVEAYFEAMQLEMERVLPLLDPSRSVTQIHFGGGTPNAVPMRFLEGLIERLRRSFSFASEAEVAIECDPSLVTPARLEELRRMGFNRVSFGIQDLRDDVLEAVNRRPPRIPPSELVRRCRDLGFRGINLDLIYGLPFQTPSSMRETVEGFVAAEPDRIAAFSYAHVPWIKSHQKTLEALRLPGPDQKLAMAVDIHSRLTAAGYAAIGMDHFARPGDALELALRDGRLHRNFQGYCETERTGQVYAFGASAISQLHWAYAQNIKDAREYIEAVEASAPDGLPLERGYLLSPRDVVVRDLINGLMGPGILDVAKSEELARRMQVEPWLEGRGGLANGLHDRLAPFVQEGLLQEQPGVYRLTSRGRLAVRIIAQAIDPLIGRQSASAQESSSGSVSSAGDEVNRFSRAI